MMLTADIPSKLGVYHTININHLHNPETSKPKFFTSHKYDDTFVKVQTAHAK